MSWQESVRNQIRMVMSHRYIQGVGYKLCTKLEEVVHQERRVVSSAHLHGVLLHHSS